MFLCYLNRLVFLMDTVCVSSDVWIEFLYLILMYVGLQIVKINV